MNPHPVDTALDLDWLKDVAGLQDADIAGWDRGAWNQWSRAMHADRQEPHPAVPAWMRPLVGNWHRDFSLPFPSVGQLWPTGHDWFVEIDAHPDFTLTVEEPEPGHAPALQQLRQAWRHAAWRGAIPLMMISLVPVAPWGAAVCGRIEAFYTLTQTSEAGLAADLEQLLGTGPAAAVAAFKDAAHLCREAGLSAEGPERACTRGSGCTDRIRHERHPRD